MNNPYLVNLSEIGLGVDYKFILLKSDMPDWEKLMPALRKFVKLITEDDTYRNEWRALTNHATKNRITYKNLEIANIETIRAESEALIADFDDWRHMFNYIQRIPNTKWDFLAAYTQWKEQLFKIENDMFTRHRYFEFVLSFAIRMFSGHEQDDTQHIQEDVMKLWKEVKHLPVTPCTQN